MFGLLMGAIFGALKTTGDIVNDIESEQFRSTAKKTNEETYVDHYGATRLTSNNHHAAYMHDKNGDVILYDCGKRGEKKVPLKNYSSECRDKAKQKLIIKQELEGKRFIDPEEKRDAFAKESPILLDRKHNMKKCKVRRYSYFAKLAFDINTKKIYDYNISLMDKDFKLINDYCNSSYGYSKVMNSFTGFVADSIANMDNPICYPDDN